MFRFTDVGCVCKKRCNGPTREEGPPFIQRDSGSGLWPAFGGLHKALLSALAPVFSRLWRFRLFVFRDRCWFRSSRGRCGFVFVFMCSCATYGAYSSKVPTFIRRRKNGSTHCKQASFTYHDWHAPRAYEVGKAAGLPGPYQTSIWGRGKTAPQSSDRRKGHRGNKVGGIPRHLQGVSKVLLFGVVISPFPPH